MCSDKKWEESDNSAETNKVYVATKFFLAGCQHQEESVVTKKLLSRQIKQAESRNYVAIRDSLS